MTLTRSTWLRRLAVLACAAALPIGLGACGNSKSRQTEVDNEAEYVNAGPLTYQVQISRELNPMSAEDSQYLKGLPPSEQHLSPNQVWFGIFLWAKNDTSGTHISTNSFDIIDTQGNRFYPVPLTAQANQFVWTSQTLRPNETQPLPDSPAFYGPTQGELVLFKLSAKVYDNRPLLFRIFPPGGTTQPSTVSLDL